jgi:hypothetical protein
MDNIFVNDLLRRIDLNDEVDGKIYRLLWINTNNTKCFIIDIENQKALPELIEMEQLVEGLEQGSYVKEKEFSIKQTLSYPVDLENDERLQKVYSVVKFLVEDNEPGIYMESTRSKLIREAMEKFDVRKYETILKHVRRYWQGGKTIASLLSRYYNCGGPGKLKACGDKKKGRPRKLNSGDEGFGTNVDENIRNKMINAFEKRKGSQKLTIKQTYDLMVNKYFSIKTVVNGETRLTLIPSDEIPSYQQFLYWYKKYNDPVKEFKKTEGHRKFNLKGRALLSDSTQEVMGPGSRYQFDASSADLYVVNDYNPNEILGKPTIYTIVDVFSRMICGIYVGFEENSWDGASMALVNMIEDKVEFSKRYGIEITEDEWPCKYIPHTILADRGEFNSKLPNNLVQNLNIAVEIAAPYRGDAKGVVEKTHDLIHTEYKPLLPGSVYKSSNERGERDPRKDAKITLKNFTAIIIRIVLYLNNGRCVSTYPLDKYMLRDNVTAVPLQLWNWGIKNVSGRLRSVPDDILKFNIMPNSKGRVTEHGIKLNNLYYTCEMAERSNWFSQARIKESWPIQVHYDMRDMSYIYLYNDKLNKIERCELTPSCKKYEGLSFSEVKQVFSLLRKNSLKNVRSQQEMKINLQQAVLDTVKKAKKNMALLKNNQSDSQKLSLIRINREEQKRKNKALEHFTLGDDEPIESKIEMEDEEIIEAKDYKVEFIQQMYDED